MPTLEDLRRGAPRAVVGPVVGDAVAGAVAEATGRERRVDPVLPRTGGPAGNAVLTAWVGLVLLVGAGAELLTLFNVTGLLSWHVAIGAMLIPPALVKTATTGWRIVRYYVGHVPYQEAGPPPVLLRLLGPLVVISTIGLLGSGVLLVLLGPIGAHTTLLDVAGFRADWVTLHQGFFAVWVTATGLHVLGRLVPALRITTPGEGGQGGIPGTAARRLLLVAMTASMVVLAAVLVHSAGNWAGLTQGG
jgi:hypothetical protein